MGRMCASRRPAFASLFALVVVANCGGSGGATPSFENGAAGNGNGTGNGNATSDGNTAGDATAARVYDAANSVNTDAQDLLSLGDGASRGVGPGQACQVDGDC